MRGGFIGNIDSIKALMDQNAINYEIIHDNRPIYSVNDANGLYNICQLAPVLIVKTERGYFALIISGERSPVDFELIKKVLQCEKVKLASKKEVFEVTGFEAGSVPIVGHRLPSVLDTRLLLQKFIYGGAGEVNFTLKLDPRDIEKLNEIVAKID